MKAHNTEGGYLRPAPAKHPAAIQPASPSTKKSRASREETTERILDVAEDLFSRRDPAKVTMREIADAAGVTHPLVHQYLGSKGDVLAAVVRRGSPHRSEIVLANSDIREALPQIADDVIGHRVHSRSIVRAAMDGVEYIPMTDRYAMASALRDLVEKSLSGGRTRPATDAVFDQDIVLAAITAFYFGWAAVEDLIVKMYDLEDRDPAEIQRQIGEIGTYMGDLMFPPANSAESEKS